MQIFGLILGIFFAVLGCLSLIAYATKNEKMFWKKDHMIKLWGRKLGTLMHFVGYVIVPIGFGIYLIISSL
jgi:hypothetical protein